MPEKQNPLGEVPLHGFCKKHHSTELEESIKSNLYDINHKDYANWTPLVSLKPPPAPTSFYYCFMLLPA